MRVGQWKQAIVDQAGTLFAAKRGRQQGEEGTAPDGAGQQDWLAVAGIGLAQKIVRAEPVGVHRSWFEPVGRATAAGLLLSRQCALSGVTRSWV